MKLEESLILHATNHTILKQLKVETKKWTVQPEGQWWCENTHTRGELCEYYCQKKMR